MAERSTDELPEGDVVIRVAFSSLNYKDALAASGHQGIVRRFPHVPGIDAAGTVVTSDVQEFTVGQEVLVTGYDGGATRWGGWADFIRVPHEWIVPLPEGLTLREAMILGTAGFTAALCVDVLQQHGVQPGSGPLVVSGATGGVGSVAVAVLAKLGYDVAAVTGKAEAHEYLKRLGAGQILPREEVDDRSGRPLLSALGRRRGYGRREHLGHLAAFVASRRLRSRLRAGRQQRAADNRLPVHPPGCDVGGDRCGLVSDIGAAHGVATTGGGLETGQPGIDGPVHDHAGDWTVHRRDPCRADPGPSRRATGLRIAFSATPASSARAGRWWTVTAARR